MFYSFPDTLEYLERGEMVKDYNANSTSSTPANPPGVTQVGLPVMGVPAAAMLTNGAESEDEEDPRTPTSVSSQGSQGYDSTGSDFVDIEGMAHGGLGPGTDSSLTEINLQVGFATSAANDHIANSLTFY